MSSHSATKKMAAQTISLISGITGFGGSSVLSAARTKHQVHGGYLRRT